MHVVRTCWLPVTLASRRWEEFGIGGQKPQDRHPERAGIALSSAGHLRQRTQNGTPKKAGVGILSGWAKMEKRESVVWPGRPQTREFLHWGEKHKKTHQGSWQGGAAGIRGRGRRTKICSKRGEAGGWGGGGGGGGEKSEIRRSAGFMMTSDVDVNKKKQTKWRRSLGKKDVPTARFPGGRDPAKGKGSLLRWNSWVANR